MSRVPGSILWVGTRLVLCAFELARGSCNVGDPLDPERYTISTGGRAVALTSRELELLKALLEAKGRALGREYLLETLWGRDRKVGTDSRTLDVHVRCPLNKLGREGQRILTVRKVGYRVDTSLVVPEQGPLPGT